MPAGGLLQRLAQHIAAELDDHPSLLGERDEVLGAEPPAGRMVPAQQRLEAGKLVGGEPGDRLIEHGDLLPLERLAEIAFQRKPTLVLAAHGRIEDLDAVGAAALGPEHGDLAFAEHVLSGHLASVMDDDADRGGEHDLLGADLHGGAQRSPDPLGKRRHVVRVGLRDQQDGELVAAETGERVAGPGGVGGPARQQDPRVREVSIEAALLPRLRLELLKPVVDK